MTSPQRNEMDQGGHTITDHLVAVLFRSERSQRVRPVCACCLATLERQQNACQGADANQHCYSSKMEYSSHHHGRTACALQLSWSQDLR